MEFERGGYFDAAGNEHGRYLDYDAFEVECKTLAECEEVKKQYWNDERVASIFIEERTETRIYYAGPERKRNER